MDIKKIALLLSASFLFSGCVATSEEKELTDEELKASEEINMTVDSSEESETEEPSGLSLTTLQDQIFTLVKINGYEPPVRDNLVSISFSYTNTFGDIIRGNTGCNNFFTTYNTQRSVLITGEIVSTDNRCVSDQMQIEGFMHRVYSQKPLLTFMGRQLTLKTQESLLTFEREATPAELAAEIAAEILAEKEKKENAEN